MKKQPLKYRLNVIGGALVIFLCIRTYIPVFAQRAGLDKNFTLWLLVCCAALALSCLVPIAFIEKMCDFHPFLFGEKRWNITGLSLVMHSMLLFIGAAVVNGIILIPLEKAGIVFPQQTLQQTDNIFTLALYFVFTAVVPAVCEELFIRGYVLNMLRPYGTRFAVMASAFIFMIMHTQVQSFLPVLCAGVLLACIYVLTDNIYLSMLLHFINNSYSFIMMYALQGINGISSVGFASFILALIMATGLAAEMHLRRKQVNVFAPLGKGAEKNAKFITLFKSPVLILAMVCCFLTIGSQLFIDLGL